MTAPTVRADADGRPRSRLRRYFGLALTLAIAIVLIPLVLVPVYRFVPPVSALMVYERLFGPVERTWVSLDNIAPFLVDSAVMSEDGRFCEHAGVDWQELAKVLDRHAGPNRGASTITMQVVKNLFLWNSRSYLRKALEIPLALYADLVWSKRRTMEIYLNIVELGPGIFGVEAAAEHYFKRHAKDLSPGQAALLVSALPNPIERNPAKPSRWVRSHAGTVAARARGAGAYINCLQMADVR
jgi:monofunctional biosynthetic peptidoglycan transglycosylase